MMLGANLTILPGRNLLFVSLTQGVATLWHTSSPGPWEWPGLPVYKDRPAAGSRGGGAMSVQRRWGDVCSSPQSYFVDSVSSM